MMRSLRLSSTAAAIVLLTSACNKPESPDAAARNLAAVEHSADDQVAAAQRAQQKDQSIDAYEVAVTRADGDHKIAIQKCDAQQGHDQKTCKEQADADYDVAKAGAKAVKAAQAP